MIIFALIVSVALLAWGLFWWGVDRAWREVDKWWQARTPTRAEAFASRNAYLVRRALIILWVIGMVAMVASTYETPRTLYR